MIEEEFCLTPQGTSALSGMRAFLLVRKASSRCPLLSRTTGESSGSKRKKEEVGRSGRNALRPGEEDARILTYGFKNNVRVVPYSPANEGAFFLGDIERTGCVRD